MRHSSHIGFVFGLWLLAGTFAPTKAAHAQEPASTESAVQTLLLEGVRSFRAEQYDAALAMFHRVEQTSSRSDIGLYLGMVLHKLGRHGEALAAFRQARRAGVQEPIADYYDAVSCFRMGLYQRARSGFAQLLSATDAGPAPQLGPRLREGAQKFAVAIEKLAPQNPEPTHPEAQPTRRFDAALRQAQGFLGKNNIDCQEWLEEAAALLPLLPDSERDWALTRLQDAIRQFITHLQSRPLPHPGEDLTTLQQQLKTLRSR